MTVGTPVFGEVYAHFCAASGKTYVGQTTAGMANRWCDHVKVTRWPRHVGYQYPLARAIRKYGPEAFDHQVLSVAHNKADLDNLEKIWIILLQTRETGYNLAAGGEGNPGLKHTEESKAKISKNRTGKGLGYTFNRGRVKSAETRQKISAGGRGKKRTEATRERMRQARLGTVRPELSEANRRRWADPEKRRIQSEKIKSLGAYVSIRDEQGNIIGRRHI